MSLSLFDPSVFDEEAPRTALIRKDKLNDFLKRNDYALFWTLLGEKNVIGRDYIGQPLGRLENRRRIYLKRRKGSCGDEKKSFQRI